jgi:hypothetical protein
MSIEKILQKYSRQDIGSSSGTHAEILLSQKAGTLPAMFPTMDTVADAYTAQNITTDRLSWPASGSSRL